MVFTQKYAIISPLELLREGQIFESYKWPLHVTLADTFALDSIQEDFATQLSKSVEGHLVKIRGERIAYFGKEKEVEVVLLHPSKKLTDLHYSIVDLLLDKGASFNDPQYIKSGYVGHVTKQKEGHFNIGDSRELALLALIDMFPDGDPYLRKVIKIININKG